MSMTSVSGHLLNFEFVGQYRKWSAEYWKCLSSLFTFDLIWLLFVLYKIFRQYFHKWSIVLNYSSWVVLWRKSCDKFYVDFYTPLCSFSRKVFGKWHVVSCCHSLYQIVFVGLSVSVDFFQQCKKLKMNRCCMWTFLSDHHLVVNTGNYHIMFK